MAAAPAPHHRHLLKGDRTPRWCALACLVALTGVAPLCFADAHTALLVSARVLPVAHVQGPADLPPLQISAADVAAGYVDAPWPVRLRVESNSRSGIMLDVAAMSPWYTAVALQGFDTEVVLDAAGGTIVQRWQDSKPRSLELRARFMLAPDVRPGSYSWPLRFSARPL